MKIYSVGRTEKHKYDFCGHSRKLQVIFDVHLEEFIGVKLQQNISVQFALYKKGLR